MRIKPTLILLAVLLSLTAAPPPFLPALRAATADPVRSREGMVASASRLASDVGSDVLRRGGNAVDAAIATAFALAVVYPQAGNLGGGGFMLIRLSDGRTTAIDYRETAPAAATRNLYLDPKGDPIKGEGSSTVGYRAAGVPGTVAGLELAYRKYGSKRLSWAQLIEPARRLASDGYTVSHRTASSLRANRDLLQPYEDSRRIFLKDGKLLAEGETLRQTDLARTLRRLQEKGAREFYEGETARLISEDMKRGGGLITRDDLKGYAPREREPLRGSYRGYGIVSMPPPSSGGAVLLQMLNILEGYDLKAMGPFSSERVHTMTEAMRLAFADRSEFFGDPGFVTVPVAALTDKEYASRQRARIDPSVASKSAAIKPGALLPGESPQTTHFVVVDSAGGAVSNTYTLNGAYGSGVTARGTGVLLNNEMDDFTSRPGTPNLFGLIQGERNAIAPGKRPLSSMTPTFVLRRDGTLWFAVGSPGGPTIINTVLQVITNVIDYDMDIQQAVSVPRVHHQWMPDEIVYEPYGVSEDTRRALAARGHRLTERPRYMGDAQAVMIEAETGVRLGASDPRGEGASAGHGR